MEEVKKKVCRKCSEVKVLEDFNKRKEAPDGHRGVCKKCKWKPFERKNKFCEGCKVELGTNTIKKLCDSCKILNKKQSIIKGNYKKSLKTEAEIIKKVENELKIIFDTDTDYEIWENVPKYEGKYQASNLGRIRCLPHSFRNKKGKVVSQSLYYVAMKDCRGYLQSILIGFDGVSKNRGVHRWVMYAFHGESVLQVDHINGIKDDNRLINLRYATPRENNNYKKDTNPEYFSSPLYGTYKQRGTWYSYIKIEGIDYYLGSYKTDVEASKVYIQAWKDWEELGKLPEKWINPNKTSIHDGIDFHVASGKWRVRNSLNTYIGIFETEDIALKVKTLTEYLISRKVEIDKILIKKIREKYGKDNRFKTFVIHTETNKIYKSISSAAKAHHIAPTRLKKHLDGEIITDLKFRYKDANTTT